jgi:hypothetical protein
MNQHTTKYIRINKTQARKLWEQGKEIIIAPCKVNEYHLESGWHLGFRSSRSIESLQLLDRNFDSVVRSFEWYNCNENELGRYAAFYIDKKG